jgi:two-component system sensor histidine kinase HydH
MPTHTLQANERTSVRNSRSQVHAGATPESLSDFSQVITHRIGSLLSGIEGYTELILSGLESREDRDNAFRILESVSRIGGILNDVRHYEESFELIRDNRDIRKMLSGVLNLLADSESDRLTFDCVLPGNLSADMDETRIKQALLSVLRNAFEVTAPHRMPVSFSIRTSADENAVEFKVYSPVPIAEKRIRNQLFNPFFTTKAANLGLGLTMARRVFREHGGDIRLTSSAMETGAEFTCSIPLFSPEEAE